MSRTPAQERGITRANLAIRMGGNYDAYDPQTTLADLLCDLHHWADANNVSFDDALASAARHYHAEAVEPDDLAQQDY